MSLSTRVNEVTICSLSRLEFALEGILSYAKSRESVCFGMSCKQYYEALTDDQGRIRVHNLSISIESKDERKRWRHYKRVQMENIQVLIVAGPLTSSYSYEIACPGLSSTAQIEVSYHVESFHNVTTAVEIIRLHIIGGWSIYYHPFGGLWNTKEGYCSCFAKAPDDFGNTILFRLCVDDTTRTFAYDTRAYTQFGASSFCALENDDISKVRLIPIRPLTADTEFKLTSQSHAPNQERADFHIAQSLFPYLQFSGEDNARDAFLSPSPVFEGFHIIIFPYGLLFTDNTKRPAVALRYSMLSGINPRDFIYDFFVNGHFLASYSDIRKPESRLNFTFGFYNIDPDLFFQEQNESEATVVSVYMRPSSDSQPRYTAESICQSRDYSRCTSPSSTDHNEVPEQTDALISSHKPRKFEIHDLHGLFLS